MYFGEDQIIADTHKWEKLGSRRIKAVCIVCGAMAWEHEEQAAKTTYAKWVMNYDTKGLTCGEVLMKNVLE